MPYSKSHEENERIQYMFSHNFKIHLTFKLRSVKSVLSIILKNKALNKQRPLLKRYVIIIYRYERSLYSYTVLIILLIFIGSFSLFL